MAALPFLRPLVCFLAAPESRLGFGLGAQGTTPTIPDTEPVRRRTPQTRISDEFAPFRFARV